MSAGDAEALDRCAERGMELAFHAERHAERTALLDGDEALSFSALNGLANRVARLLRGHRIAPGDAVAMVSTNRSEFVAVYWGCHRVGARLTPINWQLNIDEMRYVVDNCQARLCFVDPTAGEAAMTLGAALQRGGAVACYAFGAEPARGVPALEPALAGHAAGDIDAPVRGDVMLYTSGTTGRPKGVWRSRMDPGFAVAMQNAINAMFDFRAGDLALATGPLYHSGPLNLCMAAPLSCGVPVVLMRRWDAADMLEQLERHGITHTFCVPTMFHRLLRLPAAARRRDLSRLRCVVHGAAPCPVETKRAMIDWLGPVLLEMFASTEGFGTWLTSEEWLRYPGSVGRPAPGQVRALDGQRRELPANTPGRLYVKMPDGAAFRYFGEADKTERAQWNGYFTVGDIGYLNEDGYLFLTGRDAEVIIVGGVNIYPQAVDDVLLGHPAVDDAACVGAPNAEWGEEVRAVVQLGKGAAASPALAEELIAFCRARLAAQKCPRAVDFVEALPRNAAGKALRGQIRAGYWPSGDRDI